MRNANKAALPNPAATKSSSEPKQRGHLPMSLLIFLWHNTYMNTSRNFAGFLRQLKESQHALAALLVFPLGGWNRHL